MNIGCSISGILEVELTSAELSRTLEEINRQGIEIRGLHGKNELTCVFFVRRSCYRTLKRLTQKRGETLTIHNRKGIFWLGKSLLRRPFILAGLLFIFLVSAYLPGRILFVSVEGNKSVLHLDIP